MFSKSRERHHIQEGMQVNQKELPVDDTLDRVKAHPTALTASMPLCSYLSTATGKSICELQLNDL